MYLAAVFFHSIPFFLTWWNCSLWFWWRRSTHTKIVFGSFWITWLVPEREGPLFASSATALERLLLCGKHYDIMQVDLIDLMEHADMVLKSSCDEMQPVFLGYQNHILKKWNDMSMSICSRGMLGFDCMLNILGCLVRVETPWYLFIYRIMLWYLVFEFFSDFCLAWWSISVFHLSCVGSQG